MNKNNIIRYLFLIFLFVISYRLSLRTPLYSFFIKVEAAFIVFLLLFFIFYFLELMLRRKNCSSIEIFIIFLLLIPVYSALAAKKEFGQPFMHGFLAERQFYLIISGLLLLYSLEKKILSLTVIRKMFILLCWSSLIVYCILWIVISPENYTETGFVSANEAKGGYQLAFRTSFIVFGVIYYIISYFESERTRNLIFASLFFCYLIFLHKGRIVLLSTVATVFVFVIKDVPFASKIKPLVKFLKFGVPLIITTVSFLMIVKPAFIQEKTVKFVQMYQNVFLVVLGQEADEYSASARLSETRIASQGIAKNPVFGNGKLSHQWKGGYKEIVGYFFPSDIGIIGAIYVYGIFGFIILNIQFLFGYYYIRKAKHLRKDRFFLTCKYFLLYLFLHSLASGGTFFHASNSIIIIMLIYFQVRLEQKQRKIIATSILNIIRM